MKKLVWSVLLVGQAYALQIPVDMDARFATEHKQVLSDAMKLLESRLADIEVFKCAVKSKAFNLDASYLEKLSYPQSDRMKVRLLDWQWKHLISQGTFPKVSLEIDEWKAGDASSEKGHIVLPVLFTQGEVKGSFKVRINVEKMPRTADFWAGAIAHQIFHQLGHRHGEAAEESLSQLHFIEACIVTNGKFAGEADFSASNCTLINK